MNKVKFIAFSTSGYHLLSDEVKQQYENVTVLPLDLHFGGSSEPQAEPSFPVGKTYAKLRAMKKNNSINVALPDPDALKALFLEYKKEGFETIIVFTPSKALSGLYNLLSLLRDIMRDELEVIPFDTKSLGYHELYLAGYAAKLLQNDTPIAKILKDERLHYFLEKQEVYGLIKRQGGFSAFFKPYQLLKLDSKKGKLVVVKNYAFKNQAINALFQAYEDIAKYYKKDEYYYALVYTDTAILQNCRRIASEHRATQFFETYLPLSASPFLSLDFIGFSFLPKDMKVKK